MKPPLNWWEKENKDKYGKHCHNKGFFSLLILSVDGILGNKALVVLANLSQITAEKMEEPILHMSGWINGRIKIVIARSYSRMIWGACIPSTI